MPRISMAAPTTILEHIEYSNRECWAGDDQRRLVRPVCCARRGRECVKGIHVVALAKQSPEGHIASTGLNHEYNELVCELEASGEILFA